MKMSTQLNARFQERRGARRLVSVLFVVLSLAYLVWRATIMNADSLALSLIYYAAEIIGFVLGLTVLFSSWGYRHREHMPAPPGRAVDVFVTAYKEPEHILRKTLRGALAMRYPHRTWLLDDGRRPELAALAAELGVRYLTRPDNRGAKAGNLNHALASSTAEFVLVFDADHIPLPDAIDMLIGHFERPAVAMVQAPQIYYNTDAFQYMNARSGRLWHDQSFFYAIAQACRDAWNGASCVGTSAMYRRAALDAIGGIPEDTLTEDIHTSLKLHKAGFETVYVNETVAYGVAAADLDEYYKTRHRWAHGNLHALRLERVPFTRALTPGQNLSYLTLGLIYLEGWQQLMLFAVPVASLMLGMPPFEITIFNVLVVMLFPILVHLLLQELGCGFSRYWANEVFSMARFPVHIAATLGLFGRHTLWRSSSKETKGRFNAWLLAPQFAVCLVSLAAVGFGISRLAADFKTGPLIAAGSSMLTTITGSATTKGEAAIQWFETMREGYTADLVAVAGFWAVVNALRAAFVVAKAAHNARRSHEHFRFDIVAPIAITAEGAKDGATVTRLAEDWVAFRVPAGSDLGPDWLPGDVAMTRLRLPGLALDVQLTISRIAENRRGGFDMEAGMRPLGRGDADRLADILYSCRLSPQSSADLPYFHTPSDMARRAFAGIAALAGSARRHRRAALAVAPHHERPALPPASRPVSSRASGKEKRNARSEREPATSA